MNKAKFQLANPTNNLSCPRRVTFTRQLYENFIVFSSMSLNYRFFQSKLVDAPLHGLFRLIHCRILNLSNSGLAKCQRVAVRLTGGTGRVPVVAVLLRDQIAE